MNIFVNMERELVREASRSWRSTAQMVVAIHKTTTEEKLGFKEQWKDVV